MYQVPEYLTGQVAAQSCVLAPRSVICATQARVGNNRDMNAFDPAAFFQQRFEELAAHAADDGKPALRAMVKTKLLSLLSQYRLKLPLEMYQERVVQAADILASLGEHEVAIRECYTPILSAAAAGGLAAAGLAAIQMRVQAEFGAVACSFELLEGRDPFVRRSDSTATMRNLLRRLREGIAAVVKHEKLYWLVLNGTRLAYRLCTTLMRPERAAEAIETLGWCALCMEGMLPLQATRFSMWRVQLYAALCHCYEAAGMSAGAAKAVEHALKRHEWLKTLDRHDPVPPTEEMDAMYTHAERILRALRFKYTNCLAPAAEAEAVDASKDKGKKGVPPPEEEASTGVRLRGVTLGEVFGDEPAAQLTAVFEALADYTCDSRPLAHAPPVDERAELVGELIEGAMQLASPYLNMVTAYEEAKLAAKTSADAAIKAQIDAHAAAAQVATEEGAAPEGDASAAPAAAQEAADAAKTAADEAAAAAEAAAQEALVVDEAFPLHLHVTLLRLACKHERWDEVDMILPSAQARVNQAVMAGLGGAPAAAQPDGAEASLLPAAEDALVLGTNTGLAWERTGEMPTVAPAVEATKLWIDVSVLAACRAIDQVWRCRTLPHPA